MNSKFVVSRKTTSRSHNHIKRFIARSFLHSQPFLFAKWFKCLRLFASRPSCKILRHNDRLICSPLSEPRNLIWSNSNNSPENNNVHHVRPQQNCSPSPTIKISHVSASTSWQEFVAGDQLRREGHHWHHKDLPSNVSSDYPEPAQFFLSCVKCWRFQANVQIFANFSKISGCGATLMALWPNG